MSAVRMEDIELLEFIMLEEARESFWAYRQYLNPNMKIGWFQRDVAGALEKFYDQLAAGEKPILVLEAPPQHGKSDIIVEFITWVVGKNPNLKTIYASFSDRLGTRANLSFQRILDSTKYQKVFPDTRIYSGGAKDTIRNTDIVEIVGCSGSFRNTTVQGSVTGEGLDLGVIDDPLKGREAANSKTTRDKTWSWFTDDFYTRFSEHAGLLFILTRWHVDDPIGRIFEIIETSKKAIAACGDDGGENPFSESQIKRLTYKAIATEDEPNRKAGEPLFPELKSKAFLMARKSLLPASSWESLYQQNPRIIGGNIVKGSYFGRYKQLPILEYRRIFADTAQKTKESNDYSVFECWGKGEDGRAYLIDLIRGKWEAPELERAAIDFWNKHLAKDEKLFGALRSLNIEDKSSGTGLIQSIRKKADAPVVAVQRNTDKYLRLNDVLGYIESGYVLLPEEAPWASDFISECEDFSADNSHQHDDQIDPMIDAINDICINKNIIFIG